jgi:hypothetical protein
MIPTTSRRKNANVTVFFFVVDFAGLQWKNVELNSTAAWA